MTDTDIATPSAAAGTTTPADAGGSVVDRFLASIESGAGLPDELYTDDATLDATVPGWRFSVRGGAAVARTYSPWFADPGRLEELERLPVADGEVVTYLLTWEQRGVPHAAHHCHRLTLAPDGRIAADRVFCGGRWDAALLAQMAEACDAD